MARRYYAALTGWNSVDTTERTFEYWSFANVAQRNYCCSVKPGLYPCNKPTKGEEIKGYAGCVNLGSTIRLISK